MSLADDLYQAYREGRTTLNHPEPDVTGPPPLTTPDLFLHVASCLTGDDAPLSQEDLDKSYDDGREDGEQHGRDLEAWDFGSRLASFVADEDCYESVADLIACLKDEFGL